MILTRSKPSYVNPDLGSKARLAHARRSAAARGEQECASLGRGGSYITHFQDFTGPPFPVLQTGGWMFWGAERNVRLQEETQVCSNTGQIGANTINGEEGCNFERSQIWFLASS